MTHTEATLRAALEALLAEHKHQLELICKVPSRSAAVKQAEVALKQP